MKRYTLLIALALLTGYQVFAQANLFKNVDFGEQGEWKVVQGVVDHPFTVEFGSEEFEVIGEPGPNLLVTHTTTDEEQVFIYQAIELIAEKEYTFSLAIRNLSAEDACWWCHIFTSDVEPADGNDVTETTIAGFDAWTAEYAPFAAEGWEGLIDTFQTANRTDNIFIPTYDGIHYLGINVGSCAGTGDHIFVFDNFALIDPDLPPENTGIDDQTSGKNYLLSFYPNPASKNLRITYRLDKRSDVEITLINSLGQTVATLTDDSQAIGVHRKSFDCSDLADGLYYGIMQTDNTTLTKKVIITK
jgi:hypothetical protein